MMDAVIPDVLHIQCMLQLDGVPAHPFIQAELELICGFFRLRIAP